MFHLDDLTGNVCTFLDESECLWEVREIREPLLPERSQLLARPEFSGGWLLFSSALERRRLAPLPPGWRAAPPAQLRRWCADASPARSTADGPERTHVT
jgi:hypothetical protein